jgi:maltooligosyltrehalose trehalohydrolase
VVTNYSSNSGNQVSVIAESDANDYRLLAPIQVQNDSQTHNLTMQWADDFHHALWAYLSGEQLGYYKDFGTLDQLAKALSQGWVYDGQYSQFRQKVHGSKLPDDFDLRRLIVCLSNHDQIGNRGLGDRPGATLSDAKLMQAAALTILSPFTPLVFQGEEFNASTPFQFFADYSDEQIRKECITGRREEFSAFGWDSFYADKFGETVTLPDPVSDQAFQASKLNWEELHTQHQSELLKWYRQLIDIRKRFIKSSPIRRSDVKVSVQRVLGDNDSASEILILHHSELVVICNFSTVAAEVNLHDFGDNFEVLLSSDANYTTGQVSEQVMQIAANCVYVIVAHG